MVRDEVPDWLDDRPDNYLEEYIPEEWPHKYTSGDPDEELWYDDRIDHESITYYFPREILSELKEVVNSSLKQIDRLPVTEPELIGGIVSFFSMSSALIEQRTVYVLHDNLIAEEYLESNNTFRLLNRSLNQGARENLLLRTGLIAEDLRGEMKNVRRVRNKLLHNPYGHLSMNSVSEIQEEMELAFETFCEINRIMREERPRETMENIPPEDIPKEDLSELDGYENGEFVGYDDAENAG